MKELALYSAAKAALVKLQRVDEIKTIRDKAMAAQMYAQLAKDPELMDHATEVRVRLRIRRAGEVLHEMKANGQRDPGKGGDRNTVLGGDCETHRYRSDEAAILALAEIGEAAKGTAGQEAKIARVQQKAQAAIEPKGVRPTKENYQEYWTA